MRNDIGMNNDIINNKSMYVPLGNKIYEEDNDNNDNNDNMDLDNKNNNLDNNIISNNNENKNINNNSNSKNNNNNFNNNNQQDFNNNYQDFNNMPNYSYNNINSQNNNFNNNEMIMNLNNSQNNNNYQNNYDNVNLENNNININNYNNNLNNNNQINNNFDNEQSETMSMATSRFTMGSFGSRLFNFKNNIMNKYKKYVYIWPLFILIIFGIIFFLKYFNYDGLNIIIIFSIIMGLIILYNLFLFNWKDLRKYTKMANKDKKKLLEYFSTNNIKIEDIGNQIISLNKFMDLTIESHNMSYEEYMKNVFPFLSKALKELGLNLYYEENLNNNNIKYMKEL